MKYLSGLLAFGCFLFSNVIISQELNLQECEFIEFNVNDNIDVDSDGDLCEGHFSISNSAYYSNGSCDESAILWTVTIDLYDDGVPDVEYRSDLPETDESLDDTNGNGIPDLYIAPTADNEEQIISLTDISGPFSEHGIRWKVSDECDLGALCISNFNLVDKKSPTPFCVSIGNVQLEGDSVEIIAADFNVGVFDNCSDQDDIVIAFDSLGLNPTRFITHQDSMDSPLDLRVYFIDESGNSDFCSVYLIINPVVGLRGQVLNDDEEPIEGAIVRLDSNLSGFPREAITDENGDYNFEAIRTQRDYSLSVQKEDPFLLGITTLDLVPTIRHILGLQQLESPYLHFAADINADNSIKINDITLMRKLILGIINNVPNNTSWRFFDAAHEFSNQNTPFDDPPSSIIEFNHVGYGVSYDFIGVKVGDIR